jgi:hypothetical protein
MRREYGKGIPEVLETRRSLPFRFAEIQAEIPASGFALGETDSDLGDMGIEQVLSVAGRFLPGIH